MGGGHEDCWRFVPGHANVSDAILRFEISDGGTAWSGNSAAEALIVQFAGLVRDPPIGFSNLTMGQGDYEDQVFGASELTLWPAVNTLLNRLASEIRRILAPTGLYLYGSLTTGDFDPKYSDGFHPTLDPEEPALYNTQWKYEASSHLWRDHEHQYSRRTYFSSGQAHCEL